MLQQGFSVAGIAAKPVDVLRRASGPNDARKIATALIADKAAPATRMQLMVPTAAIHSALPKRDGVTVIGGGAPARWRLADA